MADTRKFLQVQKTSLAGSGISATATTIILSSLEHIAAVGGGTVAMTDLGTLAWGTLEPGTSREEVISFTGITQNADGTATLTGVTRNLKTYSPYDQYSATGYAHAGGAVFIITNNPQMYDNFANKGNDETITGLWDFSTSIPTLPASNPTTANQATRKTYVDGLDALAMHLAGTETVTGVKTFTSTAKPKYDTHPTFSANEELIDKKYADDLAIAGAPNASETVKGIVEEATDAEVTAGTAAGATGARLFVNPAKLTSAGASSSSGTTEANKIIRANSTGKLDVSYLIGGTGADGALSISSGTTTVNLGGAQFYVLNYTSISITGTGKLAFSNPHANGTTIIIRSQGNVTLTSSSAPMIDCSGLGGDGGAASSGGNNSGTDGISFSVFRTNKAPSGTGGAVPTTLILSSLIFNSTIFSQKYPYLFVGAGGASGGANSTTATSGTGGKGGGCLIIECGGAWNFTTANGISVAGANGGNAGTPTGGGNRPSAGGGGGGGGFCLVMYKTLTAHSGTINVSGGTGGTGTQTGTGSSIQGGGGGGSATNAGVNGTNGASGNDAPGGAGGAGLSLVTSIDSI